MGRIQILQCHWPLKRTLLILYSIQLSIIYQMETTKTCLDGDKFIRKQIRGSMQNRYLADEVFLVSLKHTGC